MKSVKKLKKRDKGCIIERKKNETYLLKYDVARQNGRRQTRYETVHGTEERAIARLREILVSIDKDEYVDRSRAKVYEYVLERINHWHRMEKIGETTRERYLSLANVNIKPHIGDVALHKLRPSDIEDWYATLKLKGRQDGRGGLSPRTIRHAGRLLGHALRDAKKQRLVGFNAVAEAEGPKLRPGKVNVLTGETASRLLTLLKDRAIFLPFVLALYCGLRRGEIAALRWGNVDLDRKVIRVREALAQTAAGISTKAPKTQAGNRDLVAPDFVVEALRERRREQLEARLALGIGKLTDEAYVISDLGDAPLQPHSISERWRVTMKKLGMAVTFHQLRHSHASLLIDAGIDPATVSGRLGHRSAVTTLSVYTHRVAVDDSKAAEAITAAIAVPSVR